jgi:Tfp pilus assembly protein PilF
LTEHDYLTAAERLEQALLLVPIYAVARNDLRVAYTNRGVTLLSKPSEAMVYFHKALYVDPDGSAVATENLSNVMRKMRTDPNNFSQRVQLADSCLALKDYCGAIVE